MRTTLLILAVLTFALANAQKRDLLNFELKAHLKQVAPGELVHVYLRGETASIEGYVREHAGLVKGFINGIVACALPAEAFSTLSDQPFVSYVEFAASRPEVLGDMMIMNNNVQPVHQGAGGLPLAYTGSDVIIGIIDTGIELAHPDFQHADGSTRVIALWDQTQAETFPFRVPQPYGYGQEWNSEEIDAGLSGHQDQAQYFGHGSTVSGVAVGNANATGNFIGVAPEADIIVVSSKFNIANWKASVADAVDWIFAKAEAMGKPAVVNASLGDYYGSHDALDAPALFIESLLDAAPGRAMVAAAGNSDQFAPYHLGYNIPETDTAFTWFAFNPNSVLGYGAVFFECWTDVAGFENAHFTLGADLAVPSFQFRGYAGWRTAAANLNQVITDTIFFNSSTLAVVSSWVGLRGDQYQIQMVLTQPFSNQYKWRFATTGGGQIDCWSYEPFGTSGIESTGLPTLAQYPAMAKYRMPDKNKTIVDSWTCSDKVFTVGNYINRNSFVNYSGGITSNSTTPGSISPNCSRGPTRDFRQKPDVSASGDMTLSAGRLATITSMINTNSPSLAFTGMHYSNGGTSMASPVVAGVTALYFGRCNQAYWYDVKDALITTAIADPFTGALPGQQFGHGKTDAFGTLLTSVHPIMLPQTAFSICEGESLEISAPGNYTGYTWSDGSQSQSIVISEEGTYDVAAFDEKGCLQKSAQVSIEVWPVPPVPMIEQQGADLVASGIAGAWQWYLNGTPVAGADAQQFSPLENGTYQVEAISGNGCSTISAPFEFTIITTENAIDRPLMLYPNPTRNEIYISGTVSNIMNITILDATGRLAQQQVVKASESILKVQVATLASGVYVVEIQLYDGSIMRSKVLVEK